MVRKVHAKKEEDEKSKLLAGMFLDPATDELYVVTFKREWYENFSFDFPSSPQKGYGQIASLALLQYCVDQQCDNIVAVMPNGTAYCASVQSCINFYNEHHTDVSKTRGKAHMAGEVASPIQFWKRIYPQDWQLA